MNTHVRYYADRSIKAGIGFLLFSLLFVLIFLPVATEIIEYSDARALIKLKQEARERYETINNKTFDELMDYKSMKILKQENTGLVMQSIFTPHESFKMSWSDYPVCYANEKKITEYPPGSTYLQRQHWEKNISKSGKRIEQWYWVGRIPPEATHCKLCSEMQLTKFCGYDVPTIIKNKYLCTDFKQVNRN